MSVLVPITRLCLRFFRHFSLTFSLLLLVVVLAVCPLIVNNFIANGTSKRRHGPPDDWHWAIRRQWQERQRQQQQQQQRQQRRQQRVCNVSENCSQSLSMSSVGQNVLFNVKMRSNSNDTIFRGTEWISKQCIERNYGDLEGWPTASVIITFCDNEKFADLIHTLHSIIQRTPARLLREIVLVDDNTKLDDFKEVLDNYCRSVFGGKVRRIRSDVTLGLIKARLLGARNASGDVIVIMDAHMEVQEKWLEALLFELKEDEKIMATITIDIMSPNDNGTWTYEHRPGSFICTYGWDFIFGYTFPRYQHFVKYHKNQTIPIPTPCTIGNWAMHKRFFKEIGELDEDMLMWGGENLDIAIRTWLFGGRVLHIPCSHVAHQERPGQRDYRLSWNNYTLVNYRRLVDVWFDDYKQYFYEALPTAKTVEAGNLTSRLKLRTKALHNFEWYLRNVFPALGVYDRQSLAYRNLRNLALNKCAKFEHGKWHLIVGECQDTSYVIFLSEAFILRMGPYLFEGRSLHQETHMGVSLTELDKPHLARWVHWKNGPVKLHGEDLCLQHNEANITLESCNHCLLTQRWSFDHYTPQYEDIMMSGHNGQNMTDEKHDIIRDLLQLKANWPEVTMTGESNDIEEYKLC